ncbi:Hypp4094 [Branchiostoma lanceolatum]|uniref:Hypp4094 protein n=1 Tax=Branchiostoma lanceolatum TaxID=7740 RepID=A0A8K0A4S1_BRALA|nr:Hypp4094 [Branchiostoma lanceolatum]
MSGSWGIGCLASDVTKARQELEKLKKDTGYLEPERGNLDDPNIEWKYGKPDYTMVNLEYMKGKTKNHLTGSLELMVENFVKRWETESAHFKELDQWSTINRAKYHVQANGGKVFNAEESDGVGSYNWLMWDCKKELYDAEKQDFESSLRQFRGAFPKGFPWEVLEVSSGPPTIAFTWRHWAQFTGQYMGRQGNGQLIEMCGSAVVELDKNNKIVSIQIDYKPEEFLKALLGETSNYPRESEPSTEMESVCPMCPNVKSVV